MTYKVTIITVCYNAEKVIEKTINSVLSQKELSEIEYIVIDGCSKDNTLAIIESKHLYKTALGACKIISEPDNGVYDAMNKGARLASGEWILYMNAGDTFSDDFVIKDYIQLEKGSDVSVVYGDTICVNLGKEKFLKAENIKKIKYKKPFCHQSVFVRNRDQKAYEFDCSYIIQADYDLFLRMYLNKKKFFQWNRSISKFSQDGMSSDPHNHKLIIKEMLLLHKNNHLNIVNTPILFPYYLKCYFQLLKNIIKLSR